MHERPAASSRHNGSARVILAPTLLGLLALAAVLGAALLGGCGSKEGTGPLNTAPVSTSPAPVATTWMQEHSGTNERLYSVTFTDSSHGWAVGYSSLILATTDGGATWTKQHSGEHSGTNEVLFSVTFTDASHGWAVGGSKDISTHAWSSLILAATAGD